MKPELLAQLLKDQEAKRPVALATDLASGEQTLAYPVGAADALGDMAGDEAVIEALSRPPGRRREGMEEWLKAM